MLSFVWSKKLKYVRFVTASRWAEIATWSSIRSAIKKRGWSKRDGGIQYIGDRISLAASINVNAVDEAKWSS